jgi:hypothetical protein
VVVVQLDTFTLLFLCFFAFFFPFSLVGFTHLLWEFVLQLFFQIYTLDHWAVFDTYSATFLFGGIPCDVYCDLDSVRTRWLVIQRHLATFR